MTLSSPVSLAGRRVFVTGGTGFVGRTVLDYVDESVRSGGAGVEVHVLTRDPDRFRNRYSELASRSWLRLVKGDIRDLSPTGESYTDVIHAAADTHVDSDALSWMDQIVSGTRRVLEFARSAGASRFLLTSSGAVYGPQPGGVACLREDYPGAPATDRMSSVYGQSKRLAEQLCSVFWHQYGLATVSARIFSVVGEHMPLSRPYALGEFIGGALEGKELSIRGDGTAVRTYLYGRDMAHWLATLLLHGQPGVSYNVGSDEPVSIAELARRVQFLVNEDKPIFVTSRESISDARHLYVPSIERARGLGLRVETPLNEAIRLTARFHTHS